MAPVDQKRMAWAARRLTAAANAKTSEVADRRIFRLCSWATRSALNMDAAFAAVQMLRDLEAVDRAEAAYLFAELFDSILMKEMDDHEPDPDMVRAIEAGVELELISAASSDRELARTAAFHRDRGEEELADMLLHQPEAYGELRADGELSLINDKPSSEHAADPATPPSTSASTPRLLSEHVLALSATENMRDWLVAWRALCDSLRQADPPSAVAAIQGVRDIGGISFNESLILIDMAIDPVVDEALAADREYHRLQRAIDEFNRVHGIDEGDGADDEARPLGWQILQHRRNRRIDGITSVVLRRFGEHRLANLLSTKPEEYARIRDELEVGSVGSDNSPE